jgi:hypothetical protein
MPKVLITIEVTPEEAKSIIRAKVTESTQGWFNKDGKFCIHRDSIQADKDDDTYLCFDFVGIVP